MDKHLMTTKEVAQFLHVNEKMVYTLVADKMLPATKVTGKWLFPRHLVEQWVENNTVNYPERPSGLQPDSEVIVIAGSNDILLDKAISMYNRRNTNLAVLGNLGSMGGLHALRKSMCHIATSHLLQDDEEYNFEFAAQEFEKMPVLVNFCRRRQGILLAKGNPLNIKSIADFGTKKLRLVNRALGTGTRLLLDKEMAATGISGDKIDGYSHEVARHLDVGIEILSGRADAGPGIQAVAELLDLDFLPLRWERFDLLIAKDHFFNQSIQQFLSLLHEHAFQQMVKDTAGYDLQYSGKMIFSDI